MEELRTFSREKLNCFSNDSSLSLYGVSAEFIKKYHVHFLFVKHRLVEWFT